jgi:SAM-dependent methyltransferase
MKNMHKKMRLPEAIDIVNSRAAMDIIRNSIVQEASSSSPLHILEAGCGTLSDIDLNGIEYILTGIDIDENALNIRKNRLNDLDVSILADLRTVSLNDLSFDIVYSKYVLEHVDGAEGVLMNFTRWLKRGGLMIVMIPNRDSGYGFMTRITPFWFHVLYKKYIEGMSNAGKPGHGPHPVFLDKVVSRNGIYQLCENYNLVVKAEYRMDGRPMRNQIVWFIMKVFLWALYLVSFTKLTVNYRDLLYIIEKP